ncbi:hypothetical protein E6H22_07610 [Candidatus Bathyarchaeota archaeon]|nr:MAG: hypothetical protein E6H22_07610 [Candidatus Bathyarchaeota archaeon]
MEANLIPETVQNKPGSAIREEGPTWRVSHAWRPTTRQLRKTPHKPVLRDKQINSLKTVPDS